MPIRGYVVNDEYTAKKKFIIFCVVAGRALSSVVTVFLDPLRSGTRSPILMVHIFE